jgi:hypothetical protein
MSGYGKCIGIKLETDKKMPLYQIPEAPFPLIVNALLSEIYDSQSADRPASSRPFELSENLKHFL